MPEPMILVDPEMSTPPGKDFWTSPAMVSPKRLWPTFSVHEVSRCFFGRSPAWLRKHIRLEKHVYSGGTVTPPRTKNNHHAYRLYDIELLANAFAENHVITPAHLEQVVTIVKASARMHGFMS